MNDYDIFMYIKEQQQAADIALQFIDYIRKDNLHLSTENSHKSFANELGAYSVLSGGQFPTSKENWPDKVAGNVQPDFTIKRKKWQNKDASGASITIPQAERQKYDATKKEDMQRAKSDLHHLVKAAIEDMEGDISLTNRTRFTLKTLNTPQSQFEYLVNYGNSKIDVDTGTGDIKIRTKENVGKEGKEEGWYQFTQYMDRHWNKNAEYLFQYIYNHTTATTKKGAYDILAKHGIEAGMSDDKNPGFQNALRVSRKFNKNMAKYAKRTKTTGELEDAVMHEAFKDFEKGKNIIHWIDNIEDFDII